MEHSRPQRYAMTAQEHREKGQLSDAGTYYTAAAHGWLMRFQRLPEDLPESYDVPAQSPKYLGRGVQDILAAALCFRLANLPERSKNRCRQGLLFVKDVLDYGGIGEETEGHPRIGLLHEMTGDLYLLGELNGYDDSYEVAEEKYSDINTQRSWQSEPEFDSLIRFVIELAESTNYKLDEQTKRQILHESLTTRIRYKREHFPSIVAKVLEDGTWHSDTI